MTRQATLAPDFVEGGLPAARFILNPPNASSPLPPCWRYHWISFGTAQTRLVVCSLSLRQLQRENGAIGLVFFVLSGRG